MPIRHRGSTASRAQSDPDDLLLANLDDWVREHASKMNWPITGLLHLRENKADESVLISFVRVPGAIETKFRDAVEHAFAMAADPVRAAILVRSLDAIVRIGAVLDESEGASILASASDEDVLFELLRHALRVHTVVPKDALGDARRRGLQMRKQILEEAGGTWSVEEVAEYLGISRQAVDRRRTRGKLLGLPIGGRGYAYPVWQFAENDVLPGFVEVLQAFTLPGVWTRASFFVSPNTYLSDKRPLDELRSGNVAAVVRAAASLGQQGAV